MEVIKSNHFSVKNMIITLVVLSIVIINIYLFPFAQIVGDSMSPTIEDEQWLITNRLPYLFNEPKRGDIVTINYKGELYIKRIIGLPNESLEIIDQQLYINGVPYAQRFITNNRTFWTHDIANVNIPSDSYYVLGDNRLFSRDSRNELGFINKSDIIGRAEFIIYPVSNWEVIH